MSRPREIEDLCVGDSPATHTLKWEDCIAGASELDPESPISTFERRHRELNRLAAQIAPGGSLDEGLVPVLADQLLLGYVGGAEAYFRHLLMIFVRLCPDTRGRVAGIEIPYGSIEHYPEQSRALALSEQTSFSSASAVDKLLKTQLGFSKTSMERLASPLADYAMLCQLRHAIVHSGGMVNHRGARQLAGISLPRGARVSLSYDELQTAASASLNLVRSANQEAARTLLWRAIEAKRVVGHKQRDRVFVRELVGGFWTSGALSEVSTADEVHDCIRTCRKRMQ